VRRVIEFAVPHAAAGAHALHVTGRNALDVAHAVLVRQIALQHIADDFHVAVTMGTETGAWRDAIFIDHTQIAPAHPGGVKVLCKRKRVKALEPAVVSVSTGFRAADLHHGVFLSIWGLVAASMDSACHGENSEPHAHLPDCTVLMASFK